MRMRALGLMLISVVLSAGCGGSGGGQTAPPGTGAEPATTPAPATAPASTTSTSPPGKAGPDVPVSTVLPPDPKKAKTCTTTDPPIRPTRIKVSNGAELNAGFMGTGPKGLVLVHQSDGTMCQWAPKGAEWAKAGYHVLVIDLEGFGGSGIADYGSSTVAAPYGLDVQASVAALRAAGAAKVVVVGASMGGTSALAGAAGSPAPDGVISLSAPTVYQGLDARLAVPKLTVPVLLVAGTKDSEYAQAARQFKELADKNGKQAQSVDVDSSGHGVKLVDTGEAKTAIDAYLVSRLG